MFKNAGTCCAVATDHRSGKVGACRLLTTRCNRQSRGCRGSSRLVEVETGESIRGKRSVGPFVEQQRNSGRPRWRIEVSVQIRREAPVKQDQGSTDSGMKNALLISV
jgi:hypothetical protein